MAGLTDFSFIKYFFCEIEIKQHNVSLNRFEMSCSFFFFFYELILFGLKSVFLAFLELNRVHHWLGFEFFSTIIS